MSTHSQACLIVLALCTTCASSSSKPLVTTVTVDVFNDAGVASPILKSAEVEAERIDAAVSRLNERIPSLTRDQILVELARIVAMVGDGHTSLFPFLNPTLGLHRYPVKFYLFKEGLYVQRGAAAYREVVGGKVVRIGNLDAEKAYRRMSEIVNRDNEMTVKDVTPDWLGFPEFLDGLGIVDHMEDAALTVDKDGKQITVHLKPITMEAAHNLPWVDASDGAADPLPLWRKDPQNPYWFDTSRIPKLYT